MSKPPAHAQGPLEEAGASRKMPASLIEHAGGSLKTTSGAALPSRQANPQ